MSKTESKLRFNWMYKSKIKLQANTLLVYVKLKVYKIKAAVYQEKIIKFVK